MDPITIMLIGGAVAAALGVGAKLKPAKTVEEKQVAQAMAEPVAQAAMQVAERTGERVVAEAEATGAPPNIVENIIKGSAVVGTVIALLKGFSALRAREDLKYARKQWVKDIVIAINQLTEPQLKGRSDLDIFRFLIEFHPPLYQGWTVEAVAQNIASGGGAFLEHTGWNLVQTLTNRRRALSAWPS